MEDNDFARVTYDFLRFYGEMRFKQLAFYGLLAGLVLNALRQTQTPAVGPEKIALAGLVATAVAWIMEVRSTTYWLAWKKSNKIPHPDAGLIRPCNATNAVLALYVLAYLFWQDLAFRSGVIEPGFRSAAKVAFWLLLAYSAAEYVPLWCNSIRPRSWKKAWASYALLFK